ncbi:phosphogluconate dehydratase [Afifella sp. IM 167]|uniref:phosphogluconate dehydratase n=1 Tax=Afifella sp. IM 167 TaxID=2033586 RepID=UPI001CC97541|nr:phosphogluconate dehydratase [Afifella sp. IM 167]MBZ8134983.1 phosphogluconate dehydratase [Afifella sp. IM 167]
MSVRSEIAAVTAAIAERSKAGREAYLARIATACDAGPRRGTLSCGNLAHGFAACGGADKAALAGDTVPNLGIVTAYNDMLSAHQPYERFPDVIRKAAQEAGGVAQVAGGVPAMCDGVTQGQPGMDLSLFSREVIAMSAGVALSHNMFDAAVFLGICDKIVPGLMIGALAFGHLPAVFIPAGPMPSGLPNDEKARIRQLYAEGKIDRAGLLEAESKSYHGPGTCTFYGTANSNQMLMEIMGLHLPGASFVNPNTPLRDALTRAAAKRALAITALGNEYTPVGEVIDEKAIVNGIVGLHATGGSTNHTLHIVAIARAAGIHVTWDDFARLSEVVPLIARVYPNGLSDVNHFHAAGGMGFLIGSLLDNGLLHEDVRTVAGGGLQSYRREAVLGAQGEADWREAPEKSLDENVLRPASNPFQASGGLKLLTGNLGRAVIKISAVKPERHVVEAPAIVFSTQEELLAAFKAGELERDFVAVVRFQGPRANGMPELHKLTPQLGVLQDRGFAVALVTDGRMSGASGKVPAAIHVTPEAVSGGPIARVRTGDILRVDAKAGTLAALVDEAEWAAREPVKGDLSANQFGMGRELFSAFRAMAGPAEEGAGVTVLSAPAEAA